jgi:hypothetical protein
VSTLTQFYSQGGSGGLPKGSIIRGYPNRENPPTGWKAIQSLNPAGDTSLYGVTTPTPQMTQIFTDDPADGQTWSQFENGYYDPQTGFLVFGTYRIVGSTTLYVRIMYSNDSGNTWITNSSSVSINTSLWVYYDNLKLNYNPISNTIFLQASAYSSTSYIGYYTSTNLGVSWSAATTFGTINSLPQNMSVHFFGPIFSFSSVRCYSIVSAYDGTSTNNYPWYISYVYSDTPTVSGSWVWGGNLINSVGNCTYGPTRFGWRMSNNINMTGASLVGKQQYVGSFVVNSGVGSYLYLSGDIFATDYGSNNVVFSGTEIANGTTYSNPTTSISPGVSTASTTWVMSNSSNTSIVKYGDNWTLSVGSLVLNSISSSITGTNPSSASFLYGDKLVLGDNSTYAPILSSYSSVDNGLSVAYSSANEMTFPSYYTYATKLSSGIAANGPGMFYNATSTPTLFYQNMQTQTRTAIYKITPSTTLGAVPAGMLDAIIKTS